MENYSKILKKLSLLNIPCQFCVKKSFCLKLCQQKEIVFWLKLVGLLFCLFLFPGNNSYKRAENSFLFSLVNPRGLSPTKMALKRGHEGYAMQCYIGNGPIFGGGTYCDLNICNAPNSSDCSTYLCNYQCPSGQICNAFLTGRQNFRVSEMEVFRF